MNPLSKLIHAKLSNYVDGLHCSCSSKPLLDELGHHLATGCCTGGHRYVTHDRVKHELNSILRYCGHWTKLEERGIFNDGRRPDISIYNPPSGVCRRMLIDVSVTSPLVGFRPNVAGEQRIGLSAHNAYVTKTRKYNQDAQSLGFSFMPFIFESTGYLHPESLKFIRLLARKASEVKRIREETLYKYFMKRLTSSLQDGISNAILDRMVSVASHCNAMASNPSFATDVVVSLQPEN